jgi:hypothetical protein
MVIGEIIARYSQDKPPRYTIQRQIIKGEDRNFFVTERFDIGQLENFLVGSENRMSGALERYEDERNAG